MAKPPPPRQSAPRRPPLRLDIPITPTGSPRGRGLEVDVSESFKVRFASLREIEKLCKSTKDVDMTVIVPCEEQFIKARMCVDKLLAEVTENVYSLKRLTKYLRKEIDFHVEQCKEKRRMLEEFIAEEPGLSGVTMSGGFVKPSSTRRRPVPSLKQSTSMGALFSASPRKTSPATHKAHGSGTAEIDRAATTDMSAVATTFDGGLSDQTQSELTEEKQSTMFGVQAIVSYNIRMTRVMEQEWKKLELDLFNPLYYFRRAAVTKVEAIQAQVTSKYDALIKFAQKTKEAKKTAISSWNELCDSQSRLRRATEGKKTQKKVGKHKGRVKSQKKQTQQQFLYVIELTDKLNNLWVEFWDEVVGAYACRQLEAIEKTRCHLLRQYIKSQNELMLWLMDQTRSGMHAIGSTMMKIVTGTEATASISFPLILEHGSEYSEAPPLEYEIPCRPRDVLGSTSEQRFDPCTLEPVREPFKDMLHASALHKTGDELREHRRGNSSVRIPSAKAMQLMYELLPGGGRKSTNFIDSLLMASTTGSSSAVSGSPRLSPGISPVVVDMDDSKAADAFSLSKRTSQPAPRSLAAISASLKKSQKSGRHSGKLKRSSMMEVPGSRRPPPRSKSSRRLIGGSVVERTSVRRPPPPAAPPRTPPGIRKYSSVTTVFSDSATTRKYSWNSVCSVFSVAFGERPPLPKWDAKDIVRSVKEYALDRPLPSVPLTVPWTKTRVVSHSGTAVQKLSDEGFGDIDNGLSSLFVTGLPPPDEDTLVEYQKVLTPRVEKEDDDSFEASSFDDDAEDTFVDPLEETLRLSEGRGRR